MVKTVISILLITTACFSSTSIKEKSVKLFLPRDADTTVPMPINPKYLLTLVPDQGQCLYYTGDLRSVEQAKKIDYDKLREVIVAFRKEMNDSSVIFIKPAEKAGYKNIVDVLDEMTVNDIKKYAMLDLTKEEEEILGMRGFMSISETEYILPRRELTRKPDIVFVLSDNGDISYRSGNQTEKTRISPDNIVKVIDKTAHALNKKASDLVINVEGKESLAYEKFKPLIEAFKQRDLFNFKLIPN